MPKYTNSKTEKNLRAAFAGESMARNRYNWFADVANREGRTKLAEIFNLFADNEREHARIWAAELSEISRSKNNVESALAGEKLETEELYPSFAKDAEEEGFTTTAMLFRKVAEIEKRHAKKFEELLNLLQGLPPPPPQTQHPEKQEKLLICQFCGSLEAAQSGDRCPVCKHENAF